MGHFSLTVSAAELANAMGKFETLATELGGGGEGGKLGRLSGDHSGWTGGAATACLAEMSSISGAMTGAAPKFTAAKEAVQAFKQVVDTATDDTLPGLNTRWDASVTAHTTAVNAASRTYTTTYTANKNFPPEDRDGPMAEAKAKRDSAVTSADTAMASTQKDINADYDAMILGLQNAAKACGEALAAAVVITFSSDDWKAIKGGGPIPVGMRFALRSQVMGSDSVLHHADGLQVGDYVGDKLNDEAKNGDPLANLDPELVDLMKKYGGDQAFVEGLTTSVGPSGMAYLGWRARRLFEYGDHDTEDKSQGQALVDILTTIYGTASHTRVPTADGTGTKPLIDNEWLDHFNPDEYAPLQDNDYWNDPMLSHIKGWEISGYRPDLLLPFLNKAGTFSSDFATLISDRALDDYEAAKAKDASHDAMLRLNLYTGNDGTTPMGNANDYLVSSGNTDNPFRTELFHIALERAGEYASSSNALLLGHRDSMMGLMTGAEPWLTGSGEYQHDWASGTLGTILKQATLGEQKGDIVSADGALWGVADWLKDHKGTHLVGAVQTALGDVVTDERFMNGALNSVTSPFGPADGYRDDTTHPELGPYMSTDLWAALHQEAMNNPGTAAKVIQQFGDYIETTTDDGQHMAYAFNAETGKYEAQPQLSSLSYYQAEAARHFLGTNLMADKDAIQAQLEAALEKNKQDKAMAKDIVGTMVGWATDPSSIKDDVIKKVTDFAVDQAVDWVMPTDAEVHQKYDGNIAALQTSLDNPIVTPSMWNDIEGTTDQAVRDIVSGTGPSPVKAPLPGYTDVGTQNTTYTGDPRAYVGQDSTYAGNGQELTDDFLTYDSSGKPDGVIPVGEMNSYQQRAYLNWLHDPAMQSYLDGQNDAIHKARENATHG